jgi:hypothetical protein
MFVVNWQDDVCNSVLQEVDSLIKIADRKSTAIEWAVSLSALCLFGCAVMIGAAEWTVTR